MVMMIRWLLRMVRFGAPAVVGHPLDTRFRVQVVDLDVLLHMTNGRYLSILDAARISYYARTGLWRQFRTLGWSPVVTAQTITYRRSLRLGCRYRVRTVLVGTDEKNLYFEQTFHGAGVEYATALVSVRLMERSGASVRPRDVLALDATFALPDHLPAAVAAWSEFSRDHDTRIARRT